MDITPLIPSDRQVIDGYGDGRFRVANVVYETAILVTPLGTQSWPGIAGPGDITLDSLSWLDDKGVKVLLVGCGRTAYLIPKAVREGLRAKGIIVEPMDTGAACRTYNVLLAEDRQVAAALIPV